MDNVPRGVRRVVTLLSIAVVLGFLWVAATTLWLWRYQERVVFQPPGEVADAPAQRVEFAAADGHRLFGYLIEPPLRSRGGAVVIAFHGNADLAAWFAPWARELADRAGVSVWIPEYRGYGGIDGTPTYANAAADARGALAFARDQGFGRVVLFGHSLGSAIAADLAVSMTSYQPSALVLQSPFTSAMEMAARMLVPPIPWLWRTITRVPYDTRRVVAALDVPVWVVHGTRDVVVPTRMGRQVFFAARRRGEFLLVERAGHNDVADVGGERYWRWLTSAVASSPAVGKLEEEHDRHFP